MADAIKSAEYFIFVTQAYFCAGYAVVLWDWLTSLPREWYLVWKTRWTPVKAAYLFCRYWVIAVVPYLLYCFVKNHPWETCERIYRIPVALALWNQAGAETVLLIRTYAFFNRNAYVLASMVATLAGIVAYQLYVATSQMLPLPFIPGLEEGPCLPMSKPHTKHLIGFFIAPLIFDTIITFVTVLKAVYIRRRSGGSNSRLIQTFLREGIFYFVLISIANLVNGIFYLQPHAVMSAINIPLSVMLSPVLACRLVLDLRERVSEMVVYTDQDTEGVLSRGSGPAGLTFSTNQTLNSLGQAPVRPRFKLKNSPFNNFGSGSGSGVILDTVELGELDMSPDADAKDGDIADYRDRDAHGHGVGVGAIRIDVEKTTTRDSR